MHPNAPLFRVDNPMNFRSLCGHVVSLQTLCFPPHIVEDAIDQNGNSGRLKCECEDEGEGGGVLSSLAPRLMSRSASALARSLLLFLFLTRTEAAVDRLAVMWF